VEKNKNTIRRKSLDIDKKPVRRQDARSTAVHFYIINTQKAKRRER
jgi:hypothetical protein